jgi:hypothetical protein
VNEIGIGGLCRREGVGLVQKTADGDTGHRFSQRIGRADVSPLGPKGASKGAIPFCMPHPLLVITGLVPVIHVLLSFGKQKTWMAGSSPAMTKE